MTRHLTFDDPYLAWTQQQEARAFEHDLGSSGLALAWDWAAWGIDLAEVPPDGPNWLGHSPLRERLAAAYGLPAAQVLLAPGCTGANALVLAALAGPGERIAIETPAYSPLASVAHGLGAEVVPVPRPGSLGWAFDPDMLPRVLQGCRLLCVTNPHNPTGRLLEADAMETLARAAARAGAWLVVDEVYREFPAAAGVPPAVHAGPNVVVTASVTKAYGLGGLRVGWIAGAAGVVERCVAANRTLLGRGSLVGEWLVDRLMANEARWRDLRREIAERVAGGLARADAFVRGRPELGWVRPGAGATGLVKLPAGLTGGAFADRCRKEGRVFLVPGEFFGAPGHVRLAFGAGADRVAAGLARVGAVLDRLRGGA